MIAAREHHPLLVSCAQADEQLRLGHRAPGVEWIELADDEQRWHGHTRCIERVEVVEPSPVDKNRIGG